MSGPSEAVPDLTTYLANPAVGRIFARSEFSEPLLLVYRLLREACEAACDRITVSADAVAYARDGRSVVARRGTGTDERPFFERVCARDPVIARCVHRIATGGASDEYTLDTAGAVAPFPS